MLNAARRDVTTTIALIELQWNLSKAATFGPVITGLYREVAGL